MKKLIALLLAVVVVAGAFSVTGCGGATTSAPAKKADGEKKTT